MSLLSVGASPLEALLKTEPNILKNVEQEPADFEEWLSSLVTNESNKAVQFPVYVNSDWECKLKPVWNQQTPGNTTATLPEAAMYMRNETVIYNKHKRFYYLCKFLEGQ